MENKILGVRFTTTGKLYYVDQKDFEFKVGDLVIANSDKGLEIARVVSIENREELKVSKPNAEIIPIVKPATKSDVEKNQNLKKKASDVLKKCKELVNKLSLNMKLINATYTFDESKLIIYFTSEERVDFRELVKQLATEYRTRIELRQVGPRDEIKAYPNIGVCGKELCCRTFLPDFEPVTIKMAKEQGLQINMPKISGCCGKLMCCLKYEEDVYKEMLQTLPKVGEIVYFGDESAKVVGLDILNQKIKLRIGAPGEERFEMVEPSDIKRNK